MDTTVNFIKICQKILNAHGRFGFLDTDCHSFITRSSHIRDCLYASVFPRQIKSTSFKLYHKISHVNQEVDRAIVDFVAHSSQVVENESAKALRESMSGKNVGITPWSVNRNKRSVSLCAKRRPVTKMIPRPTSPGVKDLLLRRNVSGSFGRDF